MDAVSSEVQIKAPESKIRANQLISAFEYYADKIKVLSLDCFDTLLWRKTATPMDVFYNLQHRSTVQTQKLTALMRILSEDRARKIKNIQHASNEINLHDIYLTAFPDLTEDKLNELIENELAAEMEACYAFPPVIELIRKANAQGIKVIIVSDTYLQQKQLHQLLAKALPDNVIKLIDTIFCSNEFGKSKCDGLFKHVLKFLNVPAQSILHIGDNQNADFIAPREQQLHALHLVHHDESVSDILRMHTAYRSFTDPTVRYMQPLIHAFKGVFATADISIDKPERILGYASLGPIMYAFANYICKEVESLKEAGKQPKIAFLMRDAYLPYLACEAIQNKPLGKCIRISRFSATAASFRTPDDIDRYLSDVARSNRFPEISRQLLLPDEISAPIIDTAIKSWYPAHQFTQLIHREDVLKFIFKKSTDYRARLKRYLEKELDLKSGDTLVFVDLGYAGTAQLKLESVFKDEMDVEIIGRYFISLNTPGCKFSSHQGLMDTSWCDERILYMFVNYIALLEQLCTSTESSTIGYDKEGNVIFSEENLKEQQHELLKKIQTECVHFIHDAKRFFDNTQFTHSSQALRETAMAELGRLLFLPSEAELNYLKSFQFDLNVGTKDTFKLFDQEQGLTGLKKRGLFSLFLERHGETYRPNSSAELRAAGIELSIALIIMHRYNLDLGLKDLTLYRKKINAIIIRGTELVNTTFEATHTHNGYYSMNLPLGNGDFQIGILFGQKYRWVQFESAELIKKNAFMTVTEARNTKDCWSDMHFNDMKNQGDKLYECLSESSFMLVNPSANLNNNFVLRIVFRPIVERD